MEDSNAIAAMRAEAFDLLIRDMGSWATHLPAEMLNIPEIDMIGISSLLPICETSWSIPNPVSYVPQFTSTLLPSPVSPSPARHLSNRTSLQHPICPAISAYSDFPCSCSKSR